MSARLLFLPLVVLLLAAQDRPTPPTARDGFMPTMENGLILTPMSITARRHVDPRPYREWAFLPRDATAIVTLVDPARPAGSPAVATEKLYLGGDQMPILFNFRLRPELVDLDARYTVSARIMNRAGKVLLRTRDPIEADRIGSYTEVDVVPAR